MAAPVLNQYEKTVLHRFAEHAAQILINNHPDPESVINEWTEIAWEKYQIRLPFPIDMRRRRSTAEKVFVERLKAKIRILLARYTV